MGETYDTVPVQLSGRALLEMLLSGSNVVALRQILDDLLSDPTAVQQASLGVREAPLEIGNNTRVGRLATQVVRVLQVSSWVGSTWDQTGIGQRSDNMCIWYIDIPRIGPPLPSLLMGCPLSNPALSLAATLGAPST